MAKERFISIEAYYQRRRI